MYRNYSSLFTSFKKIFLKFIFFVLVITLIMLASACADKEQISYDFDNYLTGDTVFKKKVAAVMPSKEELKDSKIVCYALYDNSGCSFQEGMLRLTVEYSNEQFINETERLEELLETKNIGMGGEFYYNGVLYISFQYRAFESDIGYCALAYHISSSSNTISYIVISCENLTYMSVKDTIDFFPQMEDTEGRFSCVDED